MNILKWVWTFTKVAVALLITLLLLSVPESKFERVVVSSLILIYVVLRSGQVHSGQAWLVQSGAQLRQFVELAGRLDHPAIDDYRKLLVEGGETIEKAGRAILVEGISLTLIWIAAAFSLLYAVL